MAYTYTYNPNDPAYGNITLSGGTQTTFTLGTAVTTPWATTSGSWHDGTSGTIHVKGTSVFEGDTKIEGNITVKGRNLTDVLDAIESRLGILTPNPELEAEFDELKVLGDAYRAAEQKFKEQKRVFEILKNQDK